MRLLAEPCCATNQLTDALARIPLPELGVQLVIAQSLCEGAGNGLFAALFDGTAEATLPAGTPPEQLDHDLRGFRLLRGGLQTALEEALRQARALLPRQLLAATIL